MHYLHKNRLPIQDKTIKSVLLEILKIAAEEVSQVVYLERQLSCLVSWTKNIKLSKYLFQVPVLVV